MSDDEKIEYVDGTGKVLAYTQGNHLCRFDGELIGRIEPWGDVVDSDGATTIYVLFHEGIYTGPNKAPFAWLKNSEFSE